jgi:hypothetical protein
VSNSGRVSDEHKYKTEMCKNWIENGSCHYQHKCRFAHGEEEIKEKIIVNEKYRSRPCSYFFDDLVCFYGVRCLYYHSDFEKADLSLHTWSLNDPRIKVLQVASQIEKLLYSSLDSYFDNSDIIDSIQNTMIPKKSKFGFALETDESDQI